MTDIERLDETIQRLALYHASGQQGLFYVGILQFLRAVLATEVGEPKSPAEKAAER